MVSLRSGKKVPFLGKNIPKKARPYQTPLKSEDELEITSRFDSISIQNDDASKPLEKIKAKNNSEPTGTQAEEMNAKIISFIDSSKKLIERIKTSTLQESAISTLDMPEESAENDATILKSIEPESSISEYELTFDLENDTLVRKMTADESDDTSSWNETFEIDPLSEVCEQAYNEFLSDLIFEDIIFETLFPKHL